MSVPPLTHRLSTQRVRAMGLGALLLLAGMAVPSTVLAQIQERKLLDRIERPDQTLTYNAQNQSFNGGKGFRAGKDANIKTFYSPRRFRSKDFMTGAYRGQGSMWQGDFTYSTRGADTQGRGGSRRMVRTYETKTKQTNESRDARRSYSTRQHASANRKSDFRGASQDKLDKQGPEAVLQIPGDSGFRRLETIDDVRNLLNKN